MDSLIQIIFWLIVGFRKPLVFWLRDGAALFELVWALRGEAASSDSPARACKNFSRKCMSRFKRG